MLTRMQEQSFAGDGGGPVATKRCAEGTLPDPDPVRGRGDKGILGFRPSSEGQQRLPLVIKH